MCKYCLVAFCILSMHGLCIAQDAPSPVSWEFTSGKLTGHEITLIFKATIAPGWKLFSTSMADTLPNTRVELATRVPAKFIGNPVEYAIGRLEKKHDPLFNNAEITAFKDSVKILLKVEIMNLPNYKDSVVESARDDIKGIVSYMAIRKDSVIGPVEEPFRFAFTMKGELKPKPAKLSEATGTNILKKSTFDLNKPVNTCGGTGAENNKSKSLMGIFILGLIGGVLGLFMPCTFPMIPLTVSFFTKRSATRSKGIFNAFLYGFFIFLIYVLISVPFYFLRASNSGILNDISTNAWLNVLFALIFIVFAISFFGVFEIGLPASFSNSVDSKSGIGSIGGIFFLALTLAIVSFSCTGPILGSLLVGAFNQEGGAIQLTFAMAGFGLALGMPFAIFALFPNWLQRLPRSGGWMNTIKVVFGYVELAMALKYLSNADLVMHWGILKRETFFAIWILIGLFLIVYLLRARRPLRESLAYLTAPVVNVIRGEDPKKQSKDPPPWKKDYDGPYEWVTSQVKEHSKMLLFRDSEFLGAKNSKRHFWERYMSLRYWAALGFLVLVIYLIPGLTNTRAANRPLISGFPPPLSYSWYKHGSFGVKANVVNNYDSALKLARLKHKPILIDFTGWACVNCRKMEENVWTQPAVADLVQGNFILVSLYVDDRESLPDDRQFLFTTSDGSKRAIKTVGDKFAAFQSENFKNASQPLYVVISPDEKLMTYPVGYTPNSKTYAEWLQCGLSAYRQSN